MDATLLGRIQFGFTAGFHFIFPTLSIGMAWVLVALMSRFVRRQDADSEAAARFWTRMLAINFAVGVATGITLEFQFGLNWSEYSRFVGDIFGAPLAAEGIFAFFLESAFIGVLVFGWNKVSRKTLLLSSWMVAIGSTLSAFWIIVANSWQQTPAGYHLVNGRAELTSFFDAVFNPSTLPRFFHTVNAALMSGAFFVLGVTAWQMLRRPAHERARIAFKVALVFGLCSSMLEAFLGHWHAVQVAQTQPVKLAAYEGLFETRKSAPMILVGWPDADAGRTKGAVTLPGMLSLLVSGKVQHRVEGLNAFPRDQWPPVLPTFLSFHLMVGIGFFLIGVAFLGVFFWWKGSIFDRRWFFKLAILAMPLPVLANEFGWMAAEIGRQPWIVQGLLKTRDALSISVPAWQILASLILFVLLYAVLGGLWFYLLRRTAIKDLEMAISGKVSRPVTERETLAENDGEVTP